MPLGIVAADKTDRPQSLRLRAAGESTGCGKKIVVEKVAITKPNIDPTRSHDVREQATKSWHRGQI
jgi:hypothetical protein